MRAVVIDSFGPPDVLAMREIEAPNPADDEAVVAVEAAGITFVDTQIRAGAPPNRAMLPSLPAIPGNGIGGTVVAVGSDVDPVWLGRRVVTPTAGRGGYAELVAVPADLLVGVPDGLSGDDALALLADGRTALSLVELAEPEPDDVVLVDAAGGGVGTLLIQLARRSGATVIAAAGPGKQALARQLGAHLAVDYTLDGWASKVTDEVGAVDLAFDGVGGTAGEQAFGIVRPGGRLVRFGMASGRFAAVSEAEAEARGVRLLAGGQMTPERSRQLTAEALALAAAGEITPVIGQTWELADAPLAHAAIEARQTVGKSLLVVGSGNGAGHDRPPNGNRSANQVDAHFLGNDS